MSVQYFPQRREESTPALNKIDLSSIRRQAQVQRRQGLLIIGLLLATITLAIMAIFAISAILPSLAGATLFQLVGRELVHDHSVSGYVSDIESSANGTVWVATNKGIDKYNEGQWQHYSHRDVGLIFPFSKFELSLVNNTLWGISYRPLSRTLLQFDGKNWSVFPDPVDHSIPVAFTASEKGAWILNEDGSLSNFDGLRWAFFPLAERQERVSTKASMLVAPDGTVWALWNNLWLFDGNEARQVQLPDDLPSETQLVGTLNGRVWIVGGDRLVSLSFDGGSSEVHLVADLSPTTTGNIVRAHVVDNEIILAFEDGLYTFNHQTLRRIVEFPTAMSFSLTDFAWNKQTVWAVANAEQSSTASIFWKLAPIFALLSLLLLLVFVMVSFMNRLARQLSTQNTTAAIANRSEVMPLDANPNMNFQDNAEPQFGLLDQLKAHFAMFVILGLGGLLTIFGKTIAKWLSPYSQQFGGTWLPFLAQLVFPAIVVGVVLVSLLVGPLLWARLPQSRGKYDQVLQRISIIERIYGKLSLSNSIFGLMTVLTRSENLILAGNYRQADEFIQQVSANKKLAVVIVPQFISFLRGELSLAQKRIEEAVKHFNEAVSMIGTEKEGEGVRVATYFGLAQAFLYQETHVVQALELIDEAIRELKARRILLLLEGGGTLAEAYACRAWALALLARNSEVEEFVGAALKTAPRRKKPVLAQVHYLLGKAKLAQNDRYYARKYFETSTDIDPVGGIGQRAKDALKAI